MDPTIPELPEAPVAHEAMCEFLRAADHFPGFELLPLGSSTQGRELLAMHILPRSSPALWKLLFIGQQHGDEPAGKDALLTLLRKLMTNPEILPERTELFVVPMINPDGAELNQRANGANADLNRDHILLHQPETRALHALCRQVRPHLVVDCHEFSRTSGDYADKGWTEWPQVTMDTANHPLFAPGIYAAGLQWMDAARSKMAHADLNFARYLVGNAPPDGELRPSTLDADDARNGLASWGCMGFVIETGILRNAPDPRRDLQQRIQGVLILLEAFLHDESLINTSLKAVQEARTRPLPDFIPTNFLWAKCAPSVDLVKVLRTDDRSVLAIPTPNLMQDRIIKSSVPKPAGYIVDATLAAPYKLLLQRNGLAFEILESDRAYPVEACQLIRVEDTFDPVYHRYEGRQIVSREAIESKIFAPGSLWISLNASDALRKLILLEPCMLFGLYQYEPFRATVKKGIIPVYRVMTPSATVEVMP